MWVFAYVSVCCLIFTEAVEVLNSLGLKIQKVVSQQCWELNCSALEEQPVLFATEFSPQPLSSFWNRAQSLARLTSGSSPPALVSHLWYYTGTTATHAFHLKLFLESLQENFKISRFVDYLFYFFIYEAGSCSPGWPRIKSLCIWECRHAVPTLFHLSWIAVTLQRSEPPPSILRWMCSFLLLMTDELCVYCKGYL